MATSDRWLKIVAQLLAVQLMIASLDMSANASPIAFDGADSWPSYGQRLYYGSNSGDRLDAVINADSNCKSRSFGHGSQVCVCDAQHCDTIEPIEPVRDGEAVVYRSDEGGRRLERSTTQILQPVEVEASDIIIDPSITYQKITGFGGAFTDASGINIASLPDVVQNHLLSSYYGDDGLQYTVARVPIASTDFSDHVYSYDDVENDFELANFSLTQEDYKYKIPFITKINSGKVKFFASTWSAPAWMKTSNKMNSNGTLKGNPGDDPYYKTWANYFVKFLQEYGKHNITFWAVTPQNEPSVGWLFDYHWQAQGYTPEMERDFIKFNLGPALRNAGFDNISIIMMDDQRMLLPKWPKVVLKDPEAKKYISHIGIHWYMDKFTPASLLDATHEAFPDVPIFYTEASIVPLIFKIRAVMLGYWQRAESYAHNIIENLNHWVTGWMDWNLALDLIGGPNWAKNYLDAAIIVNATGGEFLKQPMFYALGHFSKFLPPGSTRIGVKTNSVIKAKKIETTAFLSSTGYKVLIILNKESSAFNITIGERNVSSMKIAVPPKSIVTALWK